MHFTRDHDTIEHSVVYDLWEIRKTKVRVQSKSKLSNANQGMYDAVAYNLSIQGYASNLLLHLKQQSSFDI